MFLIASAIVNSSLKKDVIMTRSQSYEAVGEAAALLSAATVRKMPFWIEIRNHRVRFVKTLALYSCYLSIGLSLGIVGPTLLDLRQQVQTGLQQISFALTARAGGYAIGSLASKLWTKKNIINTNTCMF